MTGRVSKRTAVHDEDIEDAVPAGKRAAALRQYELIRGMRAGMTAPVDVIGCDRLADPAAGDSLWRFQTLVALMLSSQTRDQVTAEAMGRLKTRGLTPAAICAMDETELAELLRPVCFHRVKARSLRATARVLEEQYHGDIPDTLAGLTALPGVGPKMAFLALNCAWHQNAGIGVDVHVHRISGRLGWTRDCRTPEDTRKQLEVLLPRELWTEVNPLLVGFGQMHCLPRRPKCGECAVRECCPFGRGMSES